MAVVYIGLLFAALVAALVVLYLGVMKLEEMRHRRGFARVAVALDGEVAPMGTHARWTLWGTRAVVDGCRVEIQAAVSGTELIQPTGPSGPQRMRMLATRVRAYAGDGQVIERWADLPTSRGRVAAVVAAARTAAADVGNGAGSGAGNPEADASPEV